MAFRVLAVVFLLLPISGAFAGGTTGNLGDTAGQTTSGGNGYSLLPAPARPQSLPDLFTISPIGGNGSAKVGCATADPSPNHVAGLDLLNRNPSQDTTKSYLFSFENTGQDNPYVGLAKIGHDDTGQKGRLYYDQYNTELMIGCNVGDGGSLLFGKGMQLERPSDTSLKFNDDGWRLKFIKKF